MLPQNKVTSCEKHKVIHHFSATDATTVPFPELKPDAEGEVPADRMRRLVRLDWVSEQDGSHILTVGLGHVIYFFAQVSHNTAQQNIAMMSEKDSHQRAPLRKASSLVGSGHMPGRTVCSWLIKLTTTMPFRTAGYAFVRWS